ncbi:efflux RND transporter periplasmic adaptor subunit [Kordiimonas pumila]|uniref:Efflux RND transporter periplasmic adaptor subunit n=1 Tax=Kordiimonas pumila TaxID=2161677 RepID=A0ABV7D3I6_9PROT|nr:efflux RND transporter periplasmic adaptor subunit [Kordiimonas pumila]
MSALVACSEPEQVVQPDEIHTVVIKTAEGGTTSALINRRFIGLVEPVSTVDISFQVTGNMTQLPVKEGTVVPEGGLLAALDPAEFKSAVREAEVAVDVAESELRRKKILLDKQLVAPETYEQSRSVYDLRKVALDNAERNLSYTTINAPFDALITRRLVDAHTNVQAREAVLRIQDVSELRVRISVPEDLMRASTDASEVDVKALVSAAGTEYSYPLEYREHSTEADQVAQSYGVVFGMPRPAEVNLLPGMTVSVVVTPKLASGSAIVYVPVGALDDSAGTGMRVWVYNPETELVAPRRVQQGAIMNGYVSVVSGLEAGEQVVAAGVQSLKEGMKVQPLGKLR